jgi:hypothetical protein
MAEEFVFLLMGPNMTEFGLKTKCKERVLTNGRMGGSTQGVGKIIIWKDLERLYGVMEGNIEVISKKIRDMAKANRYGLMVENMMERGKKEKSMAKPYTRIQMVN